MNEMNLFVRSYKIRIYPTKRQKHIINQTLGTCRWIYNNFLAMNIKRYKEGKKHKSGYDYSKWLTIQKKENPDYMWLNDISQKAIHEAFMNCDKSFKKFFKKESGFPNFKSKKKNPVRGYYFEVYKVKFKRNYIKLPILKWTKISENDYIPKYGIQYVGGTIIREKDGRYYISLRIKHDFDEYNMVSSKKYYTNGLGIDLGIKSFATISDKYGCVGKLESIVNLGKISQYTEKIVKLQQVISHKMEVNYGILLNKYMDKHHEEPSDEYKRILRGMSHSNTCMKIQRKINSYHRKIRDFKKDLIDKLVLSLVRSKPKYITVEDLSIQHLLQLKSLGTEKESKKLHKHIKDSKFRYFITKLSYKATFYGVEIRQAYKFFPSSKRCLNCGYKNKDLTLQDGFMFVLSVELL